MMSKVMLCSKARVSLAWLKKITLAMQSQSTARILLLFSLSSSAIEWKFFLIELRLPTDRPPKGTRGRPNDQKEITNQAAIGVILAYLTLFFLWEASKPCTRTYQFPPQVRAVRI